MGAQFFIIMVCMLFIFQVINIIIVRVCGPENVTAYNIAYKYFNILNMAMMIIVTPFWSACADAYTKKRFFVDEKRNRENGDDLETKYLCINNNDSCIQYFFMIYGSEIVLKYHYLYQ